MLRELREGFAFVRGHAWLWATLLAAAVFLLAYWGPIDVLVPYRVKNELGGSAGDFGFVLACGGVGSILAALVLGQRGLPRRHITFMYSAWTLGSLALVGFGLATAVWQLQAISLLEGALFTAGLIVWGTLVQSLVPGELLGRVTSLDWFVSTSLVPVSFALTGPVSHAAGRRRRRSSRAASRPRSSRSPSCSSPASATRSATAACGTSAPPRNKQIKCVGLGEQWYSRAVMGEPISVDVLVVGSGASGLAAAVSAERAGARVALAAKGVAPVLQLGQGPGRHPGGLRRGRLPGAARRGRLAELPRDGRTWSLVGVLTVGGAGHDPLARGARRRVHPLERRLPPRPLRRREPQAPAPGRRPHGPRDHERPARRRRGLEPRSRCRSRRSSELEADRERLAGPLRRARRRGGRGRARRRRPLLPRGARSAASSPPTIPARPAR